MPRRSWVLSGALCPSAGAGRVRWLFAGWEEGGWKCCAAAGAGQGGNKMWASYLKGVKVPGVVCRQISFSGGSQELTGCEDFGLNQNPTDELPPERRYW